MDQRGFEIAVACSLLAILCADPVAVQAGSGSASFNVGATVVRSGAGSAQQASRAVTTQARTSPTTLRLRYTCGAVKISLKRQGFSSIRAINCSGNRYQFEATQSARFYTVTVSAYGGQIIQLKQLR